MITMTGPNSERETKDFYFDSVCDAISQNEMFEKVGKRSTVFCMEGNYCNLFRIQLYNICLWADRGRQNLYNDGS